MKGIQSLVEIEKSIGESLAYTVAQREDLRGFIKFLSGFGNVAVFGGFVRDCIHNFLHADQQEFRDLDLVVLGSFHQKAAGVRNRFGGYRKVLDQGLKIDYWPLRETYAFRRGYFEAKLESLPLTTVYTINACVFSPADRGLFEHNCIAHISERLIEFNCTLYLDVFPVFQAFRAMDFADRLNYSMSKRVQLFVSEMVSSTPFEGFCEAVREHRPGMEAERLKALYQLFS